MQVVILAQFVFVFLSWLAWTDHSIISDSCCWNALVLIILLAWNRFWASYLLFSSLVRSSWYSVVIRFIIFILTIFLLMIFLNWSWNRGVAISQIDLSWVSSQTDHCYLLLLWRLFLGTLVLIYLSSLTSLKLWVLHHLQILNVFLTLSVLVSYQSHFMCFARTVSVILICWHFEHCKISVPWIVAHSSF